jgi:hypothetical protein
VGDDQEPSIPSRSDSHAARGEFFVVDRRAFAAACTLGLNPAVAYLAIARGAGSRPSSLWSVDAIERYTGISRPKAKSAVKLLIEKGLLTLERPGMRPLYGIVRADEMPGVRLSDDERRLLETVTAGEGKVPRHRHAVASELVRRGYLKRDVSGRYSSNDPDLVPDKPQHIWLPNAIVEGAADETAPLVLLRQMQDAKRLQLFVALYDNHNLPNDGGISRALLYQDHTLAVVGQHRGWTVWAFSAANATVSGAGSPLPKIFFNGQKSEDGKDFGLVDFWSAIDALRNCGLMEFIPHVFESNEPEAELVFGYPTAEGACESWELTLAQTAHNVAMTCSTAGQREWVVQQSRHLFLMPSHADRLAVIGIARLRYRPRTRMTAAWFSKSKERSEVLQRSYDNLKKLADLQSATSSIAT